jgi:peptidoglycan/xylan/chitin deacetylase (PgdA/CDA1 family)
VIDRRTFLATTAGAVAAVGLGTPRALAAPPDPVAHVDMANLAHKPKQWGVSLPGVVTSFAPTGQQLALTFDACDGKCDEKLVETLQRNAVPAVLFFCAKWIDANPRRAVQLAANPLFEIGNHGTRHVPLSVTGRSAYGIAGTRSAQQVVDEVWTNQQKLVALSGRAPTWYRPGTAYYDDVAVEIVRELGLRPLGFSVNGDQGATASAASVRSTVAGAAPGSIVISHMNHPGSGTAAGMADAITALHSAGWEFVSLAGRAVR